MFAFAGAGACVGAKPLRQLQTACCAVEKTRGDTGAREDACANLPMISRRRAVASLAAAAAVAAGSSAALQNANADVFFDTERYGDKEMKVSAINKVKQNLRNLLAESPELLPSIMAIGVHDGLGYSTVTRTGGPNGSLRFEMDRECNASLRNALEKVNGLRERLKDVSLADHYAFCGAVALEVTGGPRIVVQLGREDAGKADPLEDARDLDGLRSNANASQIKATFERSGFAGAKSAVLFHGAYGVLNAIGRKKAEALEAERAELEDNEAFEEADVTYGRVDKRRGRGAVLVETNVATLTLKGTKFDNDYLKQMLQIEKSGKSDSLAPRDLVILKDAELRGYVEKYASNSKQFVNDFAQFYEACTILGAMYEDSKLLN